MDKSGWMAAAELLGASCSVAEMEVTLDQESDIQAGARNHGSAWKGKAVSCKHLWHDGELQLHLRATVRECKVE